MDDAEFQELLEELRGLTQDEAKVFNDPKILVQIVATMSPEQKMEFIIEKNTAVFGGVNPYVEDFIPKTVAGIQAMPNGPKKEATKAGQREIAMQLLKKEGLSDENRMALQQLLDIQLAAAAAGGRKMSRKYCKKTPCRKMGFSQRSSCRPYKKCSTRRARRERVNT